MQVIQFDRTQAIPVVDLRIFGPNKHRKVGLVFDTGSAITQVDTEFIERIGYSARGVAYRIRELIDPEGWAGAVERCLRNANAATSRGLSGRSRREG